MPADAGRGQIKYRFVVPELAGPSTGGTVFNRELVKALTAAGTPHDVLERADAEYALAGAEPGLYLLDTLFLGSLPRLARLSGRGRPLVLVAHYLPALVRYGTNVKPSDLSADETLALSHLAGCIAPSAFMRETIERLCTSPRPVVTVEPGRLATGLAPLPPPSETLRVVVVAHLVPGKGVDRLLSAFATKLEPSDRVSVTVVGSLTQDSAHAAACRVFATAPALRARVTLLGELQPDAVNQHIAESDLVLSASSMESFGIVLAEARTLGVPIIARAGGNVANLVSAESGGELVADAAGVAAACVALARNPAELATRRVRAREHALPPRSWRDTAIDFERAAGELYAAIERAGHVSQRAYDQ
jgi:glycosyltransferase involved in cell wall biosynthesis